MYQRLLKEIPIGKQKYLTSFFNVLEDSFPYSAVYVDVAQGYKVEDKAKEYDKEIYDLIRLLLRDKSFKNEEEFIIFIDTLKIQEPFNRSRYV